MKGIDNFILIESDKYENKGLTEFQRFDKRGKLVEHKTRVQLEKEWKEWEEEAQQETADEQESEFFDETNQCWVSTSVFWESGIKHKCLDKSFLDENGKVVKHEHYENGEYVCSVVHEFDGKGNHIAMVWRNAAGRMTSRHTYVVDNGRCLEEKCYGGNGHLCWTRFYVYNSKGRMIEEHTCKGKFVFYKVITAYDENNRKVSQQKFIHKDYIKKWNGKTKELGFMLSTG